MHPSPHIYAAPLSGGFTIWRLLQPDHFKSPSYAYAPDDTCNLESIHNNVCDETSFSFLTTYPAAYTKGIFLSRVLLQPDGYQFQLLFLQSPQTVFFTVQA